MDGQGILERTWKFREKSGNLKINSYGRQCSENLFKRVKDVLSPEIVRSKPISLLFWGYSYRIVVVVLLFYVHGKHLRSCRDGHLT